MSKGSKRSRGLFYGVLAPSLIGAVLLSHCPENGNPPQERDSGEQKDSGEQEESGERNGSEDTAQQSGIDCNQVNPVAETVVSKYAKQGNFPAHVTSYLKAHLCDALAVEQQYHIPAAGALAKAFAETSFDEKNNELIRKAKNHFGSKKPHDRQYADKYNSCIIKETWEYTQSNKVDECFFVFGSSMDSYLHFGERLTTRHGNPYQNVKVVLNHHGDSREFLEALANSPYSTIPAEDEKKDTFHALDAFKLEDIVREVKSEMKGVRSGMREVSSGINDERKRVLEQNDDFTLQVYSLGFRQGDLIVLELKPDKEKKLDVKQSNIKFHIEKRTEHYLSVPLVSFNGAFYGLLGTDFTHPPQETELNVNLAFSSQKVSKTYSIPILSRTFEREDLPASTKHGEAKTSTDTTAVQREQKLLYPSWKPVTIDSYFTGGYKQPTKKDCKKETFGSQRYIGGVQKSAHKGVDCSGKAGEPIYAALEGIVALVEQDFFYMGNTTVLSHGLGLYTLYAHETVQTVRQGSPVQQGQQIGTIGNTGRATGPHLHWQMKLYGLNIDPTSAEILNYVFREQQ